MVRILIGSILQISNEKLKVGIREIMQMQDRKSAGITLPPYGLYFYRAYYREYPEIDSLYNSEILYERKII
jgi:tRNA pseudouridine38-40 synthase